MGAGPQYLTNQDMDANPRADWWSNGVNQADELTRLMKVRRAALDQHRRTHHTRRSRRWPRSKSRWCRIFMYHRWAVEGAASIVGRAALHLRHARRPPDGDTMGAGCRAGGRAGGAIVGAETL